MRIPPQAAVSANWELTPSFVPAISGGLSPARTHGSLRYSLAAALAIALGILGYPAFRKLAAARASAPAVSNAPMLALQVQRQEKDLRVSWRQNSPVVNDARGAVLSIRDGDSKLHELHLDREQLLKGSILYSPVHTHVLFQLAVAGADKTSSKDTVLALTQGRTAPLSSIPLGEPVRVVLLHPRGQIGNAAPRSFDALMQTPPASIVAPAAPEPQQSDSTAKADATLPPEAVAQKSEPAHVAPRAIYEVRPDLPLDLRRVVTSEVEVRVRVKIDESGRVVRADVLRPPDPVSRALENITRDAARLWKFAPAMQGDQPVASELVLVFCYIPKAAD